MVDILIFFVIFIWLRVDDVKDKTFTSNTYTFTDVGKNHTIHAHFKKIKQSK